METCPVISSCLHQRSLQHHWVKLILVALYTPVKFARAHAEEHEEQSELAAASDAPETFGASKVG